MDVAEGDDAVLVLARHRNHERVGASRQQQPVIVGGCAIFGDYLFMDAINFCDRLAFMQGNAIVDVPLFIVEHDVIDGLFAGQYRGQHDAVVVAVGFGAKHRDVVFIRCNFQQFFQGAYPGHAVADQYQLFFHGNPVFV